MLQKSQFQSRASAVWRGMRRFGRSAPKDDPYRGLGPAVDYFVEAVPEGRYAIYRIFTLAKTREQLAARMRDLVEVMRREGYAKAIVDMRTCKYDPVSVSSSLSADAPLPYATSPLWRFALLVPAADETCPPGMFDLLLKLHRRAGMRMQKFEEYHQAVSWLSHGS
jgi:hypothetical protein